jgi:hypothetical protein
MNAPLLKGMFNDVGYTSGPGLSQEKIRQAKQNMLKYLYT